MSRMGEGDSEISRAGDLWILEQRRLLLGNSPAVMTDSAKSHRSHDVLNRKIVAHEAGRVTGESGLVDIARFDLMALGAFQRLVLVPAMREFGLFLRDGSLALEFNRARWLETDGQSYRQYRQSQQSCFDSSWSQPTLRTHAGCVRSQERCRPRDACDPRDAAVPIASGFYRCPSLN